MVEEGNRAEENKQKEVKDYVVIGLIEHLLKKQWYKTPEELENDVVEALKEDGYELSNDDLSKIKDLALEHLHARTGRSILGEKLIHFEWILYEKVGKRVKESRRLAFFASFLVFLGIAFFYSFVHLAVIEKFGSEGEGLAVEEAKALVELTKEEELRRLYGEMRPVKLIYNLSMGKVVDVKGKEEAAHIYVWEPWRDPKAPEKGWLTMENPFYRINVNLDHSYYMLFDKLNDKEVLVYNDQVEEKIDILTGSDLGCSDHGGDNPLFLATTGIHDIDGIGRYQLLFKDEENGFLLVDTEGWDFQPRSLAAGYDVEAEVMFGLFADEPYFIDATEFNNLQRLGLVGRNIPYRDPDEIVKSWVMAGEYDSGCIKGGDLDHLNADWWKPWYQVQTISGAGRKAWHSGSAEFSKMFPTHRLVGQRLSGGVVFSLPEGRFRFDDTLGIYGDQVVGEFLLMVEKPQKAIAFSVEPVNEYEYFYDEESFREEYRQAMVHICEKYNLTCPDEPLDCHNWRTKRFAYVITLVDNWYNPNTNQPYSEIWELANEGLKDFRWYEDVIYEQMEATKPLIAMW
jgi:hypothetical protein